MTGVGRIWAEKDKMRWSEIRVWMLNEGEELFVVTLFHRYRKLYPSH